jgi:protein-disulfide isomerase
MMGALRLAFAASVVCFSTTAWADQPMRGSADASVSILVFSAFGCPYCAEARVQLESLRARHGDRLEIVFKHFPLGADREAFLPHEAVLAAAAQDRFWPMHDRLFAQPASLSHEVVTRLARELGLDEAMFSEALATRRFRPQIERDLAEARALKVRVAPTFFVDGIKLEGLQTLETLEKIIGFRLKDQGASSPSAAAAAPAAPRPLPR